MKDIRNIGIFAHVDAGKTSLSEQILLKAGAIRNKGSVDSGTAHTDTLPVERRRGISVKSTCVSLNIGDTTVNLIDTPCHADFSAEVERSLWALDGAILVVSAVEGVEPQTEVLFEAMKEQNLPVIFFINKLDRDGADLEKTLLNIKNILTKDAVLLSDRDNLMEALCEKNDELMELYLMGEDISDETINKELCTLSKKALIYPVLAGSALKGEGIDELLTAIKNYIPKPTDCGELSAVVFAAEQDKVLGRGVFLRMFGGNLSNRTAITLPAGIDPLTGEEKTVQSKITQIHSPGGTATGSLEAGEIGIVYGLGNIQIGHILGNNTENRNIVPGKLRTPLITVQVLPENKEDMQELRKACEILSGEDPLLQVQYVNTLNELHLKAMGTIQLEILEELLLTRFNLKVKFTPPAIIYKETIKERAIGFVAYTMPKPCWAVLKFDIEPAERGSGITFDSVVPLKDIMARYQHQVEQALPLALSQGRLGWQVTDLKITLVGGGHHLIHTHPLDFIVATPMGIQDGLRNGGSTLLEPILRIKFLLPSECVGRVMSDVISMRGEVLDSFAEGDRVILNALVPVATSLEYSTALASFTSGRGAMSVKLDSYRECPLELGKTTKRRNVDPLDTSKYILAARSALEGGIFDL